MEIDGFLFEMQRLHIEMEHVVKKYGVEDEYIGVVLSGLKVTDNEGRPSVRAIYSYSIEDYDMLDEMIDFMRDTYEEREIEKEESEGFNDDLDDLLKISGISLN